MSEATDDDLILALSGSGRAAAVESLYRRYAPRFTAYLRRRGLSAADAEDAVQEAFIRLIRRAEGFAPLRIVGGLAKRLSDRRDRRAVDCYTCHLLPPELAANNSLEMTSDVERVAIDFCFVEHARRAPFLGDNHRFI